MVVVCHGSKHTGGVCDLLTIVAIRKAWLLTAAGAQRGCISLPATPPVRLYLLVGLEQV